MMYTPMPGDTKSNSRLFVPFHFIRWLNKGCRERQLVRRSILLIPVLLVVSLFADSPLLAQNGAKRWSLSARAGVNLLLNDFNARKLGPGIDATLTYGLSPRFSLGASLGFEELKSHLDPAIGIPFDYVRLHAVPAYVGAWYYILPEKQLVPYVYAGIGGLLYERVDWQGNGIPDKDLRSSILVPVGVGLAVSAWKDVAVEIDVGYRILDDNTETLTGGGADGYATLKIGVGLFLGTDDTGDDDSDGLTNGEERRLGTDPSKQDSDNDGLTDGEEVHQYRSDPLRPDTDGDLIPDGEEVLLLKTDPTRPDSDGDLVSDGKEKKLGTNPTNPDTDGDGLRDGEEVDAGSNPLAVDTDNDNLSDYDELRSYHTDVTNPDTDGDGSKDGDEVIEWKTDPLNADSDGGGTNDGIEVARHSDPLDPADDVIETGGVSKRRGFTILEAVTFAPGSATISKGSSKVLEDLFLKLIVMPNRVEIIGHTDNMGSVERNDRLSLARAEAVKRWLVSKGLPEYRVKAIGQGSRDPVASNDTPAGRAKNRRIEYRIIPTHAKPK